MYSVSKLIFYFSICRQMAEHCTTQRDYTKAITFYKEALVYNENDGKVCMHCAVLQVHVIMSLGVSGNSCYKMGCRLEHF